MKHRLKVTIEMIVWMVIGVGLATVMATSPLAHHDASHSPAISAVWLLAIIVMGGVSMFLGARYFEKLPKVIQYGFAAIGAIVLVGSLARSAMMGVEFLINERLTGVWFAAFFAAFIGIIWAIRKSMWWGTTLRVNTVLMLLVFGSAAAMISQYLTVLWAVALLAGIAIYDAVAVWMVQSMQKMVKDLKRIGFLPAITLPRGKKDEIALLGGGDVVFIAVIAIVFARDTQFGAAVTTGMLASVIALFFAAEKGKSYPAIPFIFAGMVFGLLVATVIV
jgi:hypothetical protein